MKVLQKQPITVVNQTKENANLPYKNLNSKLTEVSNNDVRLNLKKGKTIVLNNNISNFIGGCENINRNSTLANNMDYLDSLTNVLQQFANDDTASTRKESISLNVNNVNNIESKNVDKTENKHKLPDWITNSGMKELNTNQKLYFKPEKTRSFKNLFEFLISPFQFINRSLLPIKISFENKNVSKELNTFKFDNVSSDNEAFSHFSNKLNQLNKTFTDNVNQIISKKINRNKKIDSMIKYQTLERALECKLINDIKVIKNELKADLAKNKFQENYSDLPSKIMKGLEDVSNMDELLSSDTIDGLKNLLKEKINSQDKNVKAGKFIDDVIDSVLNEKNILAMNKNTSSKLESIKQELSLNLTKVLFNQLSKDDNFIGEERSISKVDNLIRMVSKDIHENMGEPTEKLITLLNNSFYKNIKNNDNGNDLLTRLFKNSSNNINYKWAQDAIILLISYQSFESKMSETTEYFSDGKMMDGGNGTISIQSTVLENKLKGIFSRLGLSIDNLDKSKDEVMRKYFSNYFEHV